MFSDSEFLDQKFLNPVPTCNGEYGITVGCPPRADGGYGISNSATMSIEKLFRSHVKKKETNVRKNTTAVRKTDNRKNSRRTYEQPENALDPAI